LMLIMHLPPITPTVFRYSYPLTWTSTDGRFPAASCSMASSGTTMPVLLPVTATVVSNVTLSGSAAIASSAFLLPEWPSLMPGRRRAGGGLIGDPEAGSHLGGEARSVGIEPAT